MPLYKSVTINANTRLLVWKNTESMQELCAEVTLKDVCINKMAKMKSESHRKAFLGVRMLMQEIGYTDFDLYYDADGVGGAAQVQLAHLTTGLVLTVSDFLLV